jgi:hypothetical protein
MDNVTLKKKLSSFVSDKGYLINVTDEVYYELLKAWEAWPGPSKEFYRSLGYSSSKLAGLIGKAKKMQREGRFPENEFKEIKIDAATGQLMESGPCTGMEILWSNGKIIRFSQVDLLIDFLKKAA